MTRRRRVRRPQPWLIFDHPPSGILIFASEASVPKSADVVRLVARLLDEAPGAKPKRPIGEA